jgi:hypothetical protein
MSHSARFCLVIASCGCLGLGFGALTSQTSLNQCTTQPTTDACLTQTPWLKMLEGMGQGFLVGTCAAVGASWNVLKENR